LRTSAYTTEGDARGTQRHTAKVVLRAGAQGDADYEALTRIDLPPGRYQLRMAAYHEAIGKTGTVTADVVVPDFGREPASISGVVLSATPGRPSAPRDLLVGIVPLVPTAQRTFASSDRVTALFDLYQSNAASIVAASVAVRITNGRGDAVITDTISVGAGRFAAAEASTTPTPTTVVGGSAAARSGGVSTPQRRDAFVNQALRAAEVRYQLPITRLPAGPYLVTFEAAIGMATLRRDVQFDVK
jgi:hypothetical protein